ncbi:ABC transporter substrate-binding protein [Actinomadura sp. HBU206391]|uniref:ABC transporter substrate-binding protein n=1 Tax=Actinomadura sp. HBU206391 TaxID=2731692 RepID=UPI00164F66A1|nr:sugar ABC transporter substrate-binding protein [Actinomadura sp. HBU206391]MBC6460447.1 sugar ABC transporter substrate-binding protein [Actinomadura sp. HBU206391]
MIRAVAACVLAATLSMAACGGDSGGDSGAGGTTIRLQISGEPEEIAVYRALVGAYEKSHPGSRVRLDAVAKKADHLARLTTSFAAGSPPDVFLVNYREYAQFVARRALSPVGPGLASHGVRTADYYPQPIEAFTYRGVLQCMPQNISSLVVYYNLDLLRRADVPVPKASWTWDDFARTAKTLTRAGGHGVGIEPSLVRAAPFVWGAGGEVVDDTGAPTRLTLDTPQARRALDFLLSLAPAMPGEKEVAAQDLETRFTTGKLAMLLSSRRETPAFREVPGLDFDVAPLPTGAEPAGILHSDGYCVAAKSRRREAAARFIAFAVGHQGQTLTALGGRTVPSLVSVAKSGAFLDSSRPPRSSQVFLDGIPSIRRTPVHPRWPEVEDVVAAELTRVLHDGAPLDQALTRIDERTRPLLADGG